MEIRHLRYFVAIAETGHLTRAAAQLGIQQPPLSQQIKALEDRLGTALFHRHPKGMALTDSGRLFLDEAPRIRSCPGRCARSETGIPRSRSRCRSTTPLRSPTASPRARCTAVSSECPLRVHRDLRCERYLPNPLSWRCRSITVSHESPAPDRMQEWRSRISRARILFSFDVPVHPAFT